LHYICSHPTAGSLLIKILKLSRGKIGQLEERKPEGKPGPGGRGVGVQSLSLLLSATVMISHWYFCKSTMNLVKFLPQKVLEQGLEEVFLTDVYLLQSAMSFTLPTLKVFASLN